MSDDLLARVEALEAERDILDTMYRYAHTIDVGDSDGWADCFTEDGVFNVTTRAGWVRAVRRLRARAIA